MFQLDHLKKCRLEEMFCTMRVLFLRFVFLFDVAEDVMIGWSKY